MLHQSAVPLSLWENLKKLQEPLSTTGFALAGGTSLALRFGHRISVDLDFFTTDPFDPSSLADHLGFSQDCITGIAQGTLQLVSHNLKIEFLKHSYPLLNPFDHLQGITLWSLPDVAAMKINAIINRGSKKDFYDLAALLSHHPLEKILSFYRLKYSPASLLMAIRSLAWFDDADAEPDPISLNGQTWPAIIDQISHAVRQLK